MNLSNCKIGGWEYLDNFEKLKENLIILLNFKIFRLIGFEKRVLDISVFG